MNEDSFDEASSAAGRKFEHLSDWIQYAHEHQEGVTLLEQRGQDDLPVRMHRIRQDRVTPDPATSELSVAMVVQGETRFRARAGFDWIDTRCDASDDFVVMPPHRPFEVSQTSDTAFELLVLALPWSKHQAKAENAAQRDLAHFGAKLHSQAWRDPTVSRLMHQLWNELASGQPGGELLADGLVTAMIGRLLQMADIPMPAVNDRRELSGYAIRRVKEYVCENVSQPITIETLAGLTFTSKYEFSRQFKRATGKTPHQYVLETRIDHAKRMLSRGDAADQSLTTVAEESGFRDASHLHLHFCKLVGVSPASFSGAIG